ncbi:FxLYD domain-containing protein [Paenibacillus pasadenensis]|uniref:FxLYD domain-containing protein n=1 Tax=Paenibacillus pasadenensis TaxID=217090 RepID=UPI00041F9088|nr:FxLYD domain-containing protein [Paenibacillus pasadenensis]
MSSGPESTKRESGGIRTACPYCGFKTLDDEASFCSRCGKPLHTAALLVRRRERVEWLEQIQEIGTAPSGAAPDARELMERMREDERLDQAEHAPADPSRPAYAQAERPAAGWRMALRRTRRQWLPPALALLIGCAGIAGVLARELRLNDRAEAWQQQASREALAGRYPQAEQLLERAAQVRPDGAGLLRDLDIARQARRLDDQVKEAARLLEGGRLEQAEGELRQVQAAMANRQERVFDPVRGRIGDEAARLAVKQVSQELDGLDSVAELADRLQRLRGLQDAGAAQLRQRILDLIVETGAAKAEALLRARDYSAALAAVAEAREHAGAVEPLKELEARIGRERENYERQEQQRLAAARQIAYDEQLRNRTAAVAVRSVKVGRDGEGRAVVTGEVESKATRGIHSVQLEYKLLDAEGRSVGTVTARTEPDVSIEPGGRASFRGVRTMPPGELTAVITKATWYIE